MKTAGRRFKSLICKSLTSSYQQILMQMKRVLRGSFFATCATFKCRDGLRVTALYYCVFIMNNFIKRAYCAFNKPSLNLKRKLFTIQSKRIPVIFFILRHLPRSR